MARKSGKHADDPAPRIAKRRGTDRAADHDGDFRGHDDEAVETQAVTLEPEADGEAAGRDEPIAVALDHPADDPADQAVEQSRLPGVDDNEAPGSPGGSL